MTTVDSLVKLCESDGLSFDRTTYIQQAGLDNIFTALEGHTNIEQLKPLLWDDSADTKEKGLLSSLKAIAEATDKSVATAWKACHDSVEAIQMLKEICIKTASPSPEVEETQTIILGALNEAWDMLIGVNESLKRARHGQDASTGSFLDFLSRRDDTRLAKFITGVGAVEAAYDKRSRERFLLENFYEALRLRNMPGLKLWAGAQFAETGPVQIKNNLWKTHTQTYQPDFRLYTVWLTLVKMKKINPDGSMKNHPQLLDCDERPYQIARRMVLYVSNGHVVPTQATHMALQGLDEANLDFTDVDSLKNVNYSSIDYLHPPFTAVCSAFYQMQGVLNTLSGPDGLWRNDGDYAKARAAISVREKLAISMGYVEEIEDYVDMLNANVLDPMLISFRDVISALQDLSANTLYGDDDDQRINLKELITSTKLARRLSPISLNLLSSAEAGDIGIPFTLNCCQQHMLTDDQWTSSYSRARDFFNKSLPIRFRDCVGVAEITDNQLKTQLAPKGTDWNQVVMGFEKIDLDRQKQLYSLIARKDDQKDAPTITTYGDPSSTPVGARARMLELPKSSQNEFGRVSNWNQTKIGDYYEIPVTFGNTYTTKPSVICWLEGFEAHTTKNLRVRAEVIGITEKGCVMRVGSWGDTELVHINAVWFAHAADHPRLFTGGGSIHKYGQHSDIWAPFVSVDFPEGKFKKRRPDIFLAISLLDTHSQFNPRCEIKATNVTQRGMKVSVDPWWDTYCYEARFSCIAFDPDFFQCASEI
ncbi:h-type lectin domain protein [Fusarium tjaetaba]|uniref:H-type lectin domain protein n=1 Tax=Fusarium tjaetaba TaxID=1567544 RepID=A0A8H5VXD2_9HYPO|nr:h-type lectin domain protein [Fusarium tjaetaba]KAF5641057.1 h-type lectin domain protein [Fusarium tjaetaba]